MTDFAVGPVAVRTPATSANLGPGFDSLGLCLSLADVVSAEVSDCNTEVTVSGYGAGELPEGEAHLVVSSMRSAFDAWQIEQPGLRLVCRNVIPQGRGLGSSAAAIVAGLRLGEALVPGLSIGDDDLLALAARLDGHGDNVAACLLGGLTITWLNGDVPSAVRLEVDERVVPMVCCADRPMSTATARGLLSALVPHGEASANAAHAALVVTALTTRPDLLLPATLDHLHQEARRSATPTSMRLVDSLRAAGVAAVISGAGPSVLALCTGEEQARLVTELNPPGWRLLPLAVERRGAHVVPWEGWPATATARPAE